MQHKAAFHQGLHIFAEVKTEIHHNEEIQFDDPLKYIMDNTFPIVFICTWVNPSEKKGLIYFQDVSMVTDKTVTYDP